MERKPKKNIVIQHLYNCLVQPKGEVLYISRLEAAE